MLQQVLFLTLFHGGKFLLGLFKGLAMKQKYVLALGLGATLSWVGPAAHANESTLATPRVVSYLGTPLILEVPVKAVAGQRLTLPCLTAVKVNGQDRPSTTKKYAFWRTGAETGVVQLRDDQKIQQSPLRLELEIGCGTTKKTSFDLPVATAPVAFLAPVNTLSATPLETKKTSTPQKKLRTKKPAATVAKNTADVPASAAATGAQPTAPASAAADATKSAALVAKNTKAAPSDTAVSAQDPENLGVDTSVLLDRIPNMQRPSQR